MTPAFLPRSAPQAPLEGRSIAGFTLIELVVVLAIMALIFIGLATAFFHGTPARAALQSSAREMASGFRAAREEAILRGRPEIVVVDVTSGAWRLPGSQPRYLPSGVRAMLFARDTDVDGRRRGLIRFYPDGSSSGGGVSLEAGGLQYEVLVNWLTGGVTIHAQTVVPKSRGAL
ncbi:MAG TPA: GspH/FimT family pseudopilin [Stellaceae bacterium]|jgi:general secretion pathway protein H|nr:GspH/FimT family pseudopilin [Stellaceae bacterium]